ncbi:MAG: DUF1028 domain-containing protein, partial [Bacteroidota bacterium]
YSTDPVGQIASGLSAQQVLDFLLSNDNCVFGDTSTRQYGIATLDQNMMAESVSFTGADCIDYKNHITGPTYAIQGNILLGQQVLDSMEARFLKATGPLANRLMEAMQGANIPGADSRCLNEGVSSLSAFLRVARPDDPVDDFYLDLNVPQTPFGAEPIDSLQSLFDEWQLTTSEQSVVVKSEELRVYPNPANSFVFFDFSTLKEAAQRLEIYDAEGRLVQSLVLRSDQLRLATATLGSEGLYLYRVFGKQAKALAKGKLLLTQ